ncbi:DUF362 domain-containing protein [uncultured Sphaerochaeta sp.]|uniref:DUF362 domain-containing protein n=1 Tax=uncultured Sphaerochaeta sp. TaxID=886478 RepID=UPI002A0A9A4C|nr:DUF362 domain-containing protein [uncultured Sphaerochaeta sp.]
MSTVAIVACATYEQDVLDKKIKDVCILGSMPDVSGKKVLLKPNILSDAKKETGITTNPAIVKAMIHLLKEQGAKEILVGDSPGLQGPAFSPRNCGIAQVCMDENVQWVDFTKNSTTHAIPYTHGKKIQLASILEQVDMIISLPKFKTHQLMYSTGATKNLFGLVPGLHKSPSHVIYPTREAFASLIVGILTTVKPSFALMDGIIGMEGAGPANGIPCKVGYLLASTDCIALDYSQAVIMGYDPMTIPIVKEGLKRNLGSCPPSYPGLDAKDLVIKDFLRIEQQQVTKFFGSLVAPFLSRKFKKKLSKREERPAPKFLPEPCIQCKRCVEICPVGALKLVNKHIEIDTSLCVRCYCCHEICPANAISIESKNVTTDVLKGKK